jgi:phage terminase large subunit GpA-like protein
MDCLSSTSDVEEVIFCKAAQVAGTEAMLNALGYVIDHSPGPTLFVQPTVELAKRFSRQRLEPLITGSPRLSAKVAEARSRDSGNTMLEKEFASGHLIITGANSAVGLRSMPAQYAFLDEIDAYPVDLDGEGSPLALVEARQRTFMRRKRMKISTPTIAGRSAIEAEFLATDQRHYHVPCPDCGHLQPLEFGRLVWTRFGLEPREAVYECRACFFRIEHRHKTALLAGGEWRPTYPERSGRLRGYHLSALYAPLGWMSWGEIAEDFVKSQKDTERSRVFINTVLGEPWKTKGEAPAWEALWRRRETYPRNRVPAGALFLTAGIDVQKDRLVYEVVGWGRGKCSWSVDAGELPGDTADLAGPWAQADELLARVYPHASGASLPLRLLAVDSGWNTQTVYAWSKRYRMSRVIAVKGQDYGGVLIGTPSPVDVTLDGKKIKRGARVWPVGVSIAKSELYGFLSLEAGTESLPEPAGFCHFPEYGEEFFRQLTAEQLVPHKTRKGYVKLEWELLPGRMNHALDARVYARAAAALAGLDRFTDSDWERLEAMVGGPARPTPGPPPPAPKGAFPTVPVVASAPAPRRVGWLGGRSSGFKKGWIRGGRER